MRRSVASYWSEHAREAGRGCSDELVALVTDFLDPSGKRGAVLEHAKNFGKFQELSTYFLQPHNEPAFMLVALDLCQDLAERLCVPISPFEAIDSIGRLPLHYAV